jgi:hypothetical protein
MKAESEKEKMKFFLFHFPLLLQSLYPSFHDNLKIRRPPFVRRPLPSSSGGRILHEFPAKNLPEHKPPSLAVRRSPSTAYTFAASCPRERRRCAAKEVKRIYHHRRPNLRVSWSPKTKTPGVSPGVCSKNQFAENQNGATDSLPYFSTFHDNHDAKQKRFFSKRKSRK